MLSHSCTQSEKERERERRGRESVQAEIIRRVGHYWKKATDKVRGGKGEYESKPHNNMRGGRQES